MTAEIVHSIVIVGLGNDPDRRAVVNIDTKGVCRCAIGCFRGTLKTGLKRVAQRYRKGSPYYKMLEAAGNELKRQRKRKGRNWRGHRQPLSYYMDSSYNVFHTAQVL